MANTREEVIAALVTDKYSGFKDGDEAILAAASDARLEEFRSAADIRKVAAQDYLKLESDHRNTSARLKVAEEKLKSAEQSLSEEEFLERAPAKYKEIINEHRTAEAQFRGSLISQLKDLGANTEEQLKAKSTEDLKTLAQYARIEIPDFSGRGLPKERHAEDKGIESYIPPDPYKDALKALQASR